MIEPTYDELLDLFHGKYGHFLSPAPAEIPPEVRLLRARLILEEAKELLLAMGIDWANAEWPTDLWIDGPSDLVEVADGIADLQYVTVGTGRSYGIPTDACFREVHRSNMTKTPPDPDRPADPGAKYTTKTPKGPDFRPPAIKSILGL